MRIRTLRGLVPVLALLAVTAAVASLGWAEGQKVKFEAELVPIPAAVDSTAWGKAEVDIKVKDGIQYIEYKVVVHDVENVTQAHIHVIPPGGVAGPPALWLYPSAPPAQLIPGTTNGVLGKGAATAANFVGPVMTGKTVDDLITAIGEGRAYVNVHTTAFPGGEINGFLAAK